MKVCLIGGIYGRGGACSSYMNSAPETTLETGLRALGHDVTTLSHYDEASFEAFDVVHVHHLSYGAARLASDPSGTPFIFTPHDASLMNGASQGLSRNLAMRYVMSRADAILNFSRAEAEFQKSAYRTDGALIETIPNGISPSQFPMIRRNASGQGHPWRLLFVGQLIPLKHCDVLLRAVAQIRPDVELMLAYQNATLEAELKELARILGISGRLRFLGKQTPDQLAGVYQTNDLLILPSSTEALPSVITEAMLSGIPFIASAVGGVPEQAANFGYLLRPGSVEELAEAINYVLDRYEQFACTCERMSAHARSAFSVDAMVEKHIRLYERVAQFKAVRRSGNTLLDRLVRAAVRRRSQTGPATSETAQVMET